MIRTIASKNTMLHKLVRIAGLAIALCALAGLQARAQAFDDSGNANLNGDYFVREVLLTDIDQNTSDVGRALSIVGIMTFDGVGDYEFSGQIMDTNAGTVQAFSTTGSYALAENGFVVIQDLIDSNEFDFGGTGVIGPTAITASATEGADKTMLVAIPAGSPTTNASVAGTYNVAFLDFLQGLPSRVRDGNLTLSTSGDGNFGNITVAGSMANQGSVNTTQNLSDVFYNITNAEGSGTITFPTAGSPLGALVSGEKAFFISADGNLVLAGDPAGFDIMIGIRANSGAADNSLYQGTYYTGGLENDGSNSGHGQNGIDAFSGSIYAYGDGTAISHLRLATFDSDFAIDYTYEPSPYDLTSDGTFNDGALFGMLGVDGQALLEVGTGNFFSLTLGLWAGEFSGLDVLLDPLKVWNAASNAPITNSVAPGEFVTLYGSGLAATAEPARSLPLPLELGNVQVSVNGVLAPISYVSPNQINVLVPNSTSGGFATFQVSNNGVASNPVTLYQSLTAPGVFTSTQGGFKPGLGQAAVQHANSSPVTQSNPAKVGETLQLYLTGLGSVTPAVDDGVAAPSPASTVDADVGVFVDGVQATIQFKGLSPGLAGLYQVNFVVPDGVSSGLVYLAVSTPDAFSTLAKLYIK